MDDDNWPSGWTRAALELCVLACVARDDSTHGYQVARSLEAAGLGEVKGGTLYPVLTRLEEQGLTVTRWVEGLGGPGRKLVAVTDAGRAALADRTARWQVWTGLVGTLLTESGPHRRSPDPTDPTDRTDRTDRTDPTDPEENR